MKKNISWYGDISFKEEEKRGGNIQGIYYPLNKNILPLKDVYWNERTCDRWSKSVE